MDATAFKFAATCFMAVGWGFLLHSLRLGFGDGEEVADKIAAFLISAGMVLGTFAFLVGVWSI